MRFWESDNCVCFFWTSEPKCVLLCVTGRWEMEHEMQQQMCLVFRFKWLHIAFAKINWTETITLMFLHWLPFFWLIMNSSINKLFPSGGIINVAWAAHFVCDVTQTSNFQLPTDLTKLCIWASFSLSELRVKSSVSQRFLNLSLRPRGIMTTTVRLLWCKTITQITIL